MEPKFEILKGLTLSAIEVNDTKTSIKFAARDGRLFELYHSQDCCESVWIEEIIGDLNDLIGEELLEAEEVVERGNSADYPLPEHADDSWTWTFYKLGTRKGFVTLRWFGTSNGYYSEQVDFRAINS